MLEIQFSSKIKFPYYPTNLPPPANKITPLAHPPLNIIFKITSVADSLSLCFVRKSWLMKSLKKIIKGRRWSLKVTPNLLIRYSLKNWLAKNKWDIHAFISLKIKNYECRISATQTMEETVKTKKKTISPTLFIIQ